MKNLHPTKPNHLYMNYLKHLVNKEEGYISDYPRPLQEDRIDRSKLEQSVGITNFIKSIMI